MNLKNKKNCFSLEDSGAKHLNSSTTESEDIAASFLAIFSASSPLRFSLSPLLIPLISYFDLN